MAIELARTQALPKPWGVVDLTPWSNAGHEGGPIGEIWYERPASGVTDPSLLLKLLFTNEPLSIQVHPEDAYAQSMGLPNGKTEAWYIHTGKIGMVGLVASTGVGPVPRLLQRLTQPDSTDLRGPQKAQAPTSLTRARAASASSRLETTK